MAAELKPIRTKANHKAALAEVERLWAPRAAHRRATGDVLATLIDAYETRHYPMDPPDPIEAIQFRMEQQGLTGKVLEPMIGTRARRRNHEPQAQSVHRHDPAVAQAAWHIRRDTDPTRENEAA
jgi:antitoxin component HigA of HigAB toxin-antitoxin module